MSPELEAFYSCPINHVIDDGWPPVQTHSCFRWWFNHGFAPKIFLKCHVRCLFYTRAEDNLSFLMIPQRKRPNACQNANWCTKELHTTAVLLMFTSKLASQEMIRGMTVLAWMPVLCHWWRALVSTIRS